MITVYITDEGTKVVDEELEKLIASDLEPSLKKCLIADYLNAHWGKPINKYSSVLYSKYIISGEENIKKVKEFFKNDN